MGIVLLFIPKSKKYHGLRLKALAYEIIKKGDMQL